MIDREEQRHERLHYTGRTIDWHERYWWQSHRICKLIVWAGLYPAPGRVRRAPTTIRSSVHNRRGGAVSRPTIFILLALILMTHTTAFAATPERVKQITLDQLKTVFNGARGNTRVLVLLSPT